MNYWNERHLNGIFWNEKHSRSDFGATTSGRDTGTPEKVRCQEKVAYSNVKYDFTALFGRQTYNDRKLQYEFTITDHDCKRLRNRVNEFINWLYQPQGRNELHDSTDPDYHFLAELVSAVPSYPYAVVAKIKVVFEAYPFRIPNVNDAYEADPDRWPDVNFDGVVDAADAAIILSGAVEDGAGGYTPLTEEQKLRADASRDGRIDAADAALVLDYISECGAGRFLNSPEGWAEYLNWKFDRNTEVI